MKSFINAILILYFAHPCFSQDTAAFRENLQSAKVNQQQLKQLTGLKSVKIGLSASIRTGFPWEDNSRAVAIIKPTDNTISIDHLDRMSFVISTSITYFPKPSKDKPKNLRVGPTININLAELGEGGGGNIFNKNVDGGIGIAFKWWEDDDVVLAFTYERIAIRRPTKFILENEGKVITDSNGDIIKTLEANDDRYYINSGINGLAIKVVVNLNK